VAFAFDSFECAAKDLLPRTLKDPIWLRLEGDSDDPATWHPVKVVNDQGFREDTSQPFVRALTVSFHDGTPDVRFNETDEVEFAVPWPQR
jgi:hypothetical protein